MVVGGAQCKKADVVALRVAFGAVPWVVLTVLLKAVQVVLRVELKGDIVVWVRWSVSSQSVDYDQIERFQKRNDVSPLCVYLVRLWPPIRLVICPCRSIILSWRLVMHAKTIVEPYASRPQRSVTF